MSRLTATTTVTKEVKLKPALKLKLLSELRLYEKEYLELKALEAKIANRKASIASLRDETGEDTLEIDDFKTQMIATFGKRLDKKKLIAQGVTLEQIEKATTEYAKKPYELISSPRLTEASKKRKGDDDDE